MELDTILLVILVVFAAIGLAVVAGTIALMVRLRLSPRGVAAAIGTFIYLASPVDVAPEALLGPVGLVDDAGLLAMTLLYLARLAAARRAADAGTGPDAVAVRPPGQP
ncbi:MAG: DUF1232 domain-containing protein [Frankia sp.]|nr:DUF1232 domain-containing protein [Frankia sp.]